MPTYPATPALDPKWKEMTLPHYLKELRLAIQEGGATGSGRTQTQPEPKTASFRRISVQLSKGTA
jgi:hypothetical protein